MSKVILKRSSVSGKVPQAADLDYGELAINYADGIAYFKRSDNTIGTIGGAQSAQTLLNLIKSIDGSGSGLDADLLDGQSGAYYIDWANTTNKPTTLAGYGITDAATSTHNHNGTYQPLDGDLTAIAALAGTSGFLKKTTADTWSLDTSTYLTGNQSISVSGDATGSGTTSIALTLANSGVVAGTYTKVTVDAKGRVTTGASLASADLPTYTGTITSSQVTTALGYTPYNSTNPNGYTTNTGTVTSVGGTGTVSGLTLTGTVTTTGNLTLGGTLAVTPANFASQTANTVLAAPNGSAGVPTFRSLVAADIPNIDAAKITSGVFDSARLPSYVDDVLEYTNLAAFPASGESGKIYVDLTTNKTYRWSGSVYVYITSGAVDSVAGKTGVVTLVKGDVGLGSVDNTADANKNVLSATKLTTARTISLTGDVTGSVSFDGSGNAAIATTIAADSVTLGTDTTGNYVASISNGSYITGGNGGSEGAAITLAVDATSANTASKVVARDASGNFSAGTITAALSGNATTATTLATSRNINGVAFNGSADITITAANPNTLTIGTGLSGTSYNGSAAVTIALATGYGDTQNPYASKTANYFLAAPNGTAGAPTFRALVAADIPTLNQNTTGTASNVTGTVAIANGGTGATTAAAALTNLGAYPATNPSGYTTNTGTVTSVSGTGTVSGLTLTGTVTTSGNLTLGGTLSVSIDNISDEYRVFNNMGNNHSTTTDFNAVGNFGVRYLQGGTNGPTGNGQWYGFTLGLGNDYTISQYASQLYWSRKGQTSDNRYIYTRDLENGTWGSWVKMHAGYADTAGNGGVTSVNGQTGAVTISGGATVTDDTTTNATRYIVWEDITSGSSSTIGVSSTKLYFNPSTGTLNATTFNSLSDINQKTNLIKIENATETLSHIDTFEFDWIDNGKHSAGVIAQHLEKILPFLVDTSDSGMKSVNYPGLIAYLVQSNKELNHRLTMLERKI